MSCKSPHRSAARYSIRCESMPSHHHRWCQEHALWNVVRTPCRQLGAWNLTLGRYDGTPLPKNTGREKCCILYLCEFQNIALQGWADRNIHSPTGQAYPQYPCSFVSTSFCPIDLLPFPYKTEKLIRWPRQSWLKRTQFTATSKFPRTVWFHHGRKFKRFPYFPCWIYGNYRSHKCPANSPIQLMMNGF